MSVQSLHAHVTRQRGTVCLQGQGALAVSAGAGRPSCGYRAAGWVSLFYGDCYQQVRRLVACRGVTRVPTAAIEGTKYVLSAMKAPQDGSTRPPRQHGQPLSMATVLLVFTLSQ